MVRRRPRGKPVLRCPQCGSTEVVYEAGLITGQVYHCQKCQYVGSLILEEDLPDPSTERRSGPT